METLGNIVAVGTIRDFERLVYGVPLRDENVRASLDVPTVGDAPLPFPIPDEFKTIKDVNDSFIERPKELILWSNKVI